MVIFLTGATGLIGSAVLRELVARGHTVVCGVRNPDAASCCAHAAHAAHAADSAHAPLAGCRVVPLDFARLADCHATASIRAMLAGVDVLINAVGVFSGDMRRLHTDAPIRLFEAAVEAGVARIVQVSALGADADAGSDYHLSKRAADDALAALPVASLIVQPSLVYAPRGRSTRFLTMLASLPIVPLPGDGAQQVQPVHLDDVVELIVGAALGTSPGDAVARGERIAAVGPQPLTLRAYLTLLRRVAGGGVPLFVPVPRALLAAAASLGSRLPGALVSPDSLAMLERGNVAPADAIARRLGRAPRSLAALSVERDLLGVPARLAWLVPLLRVSIAAVWIWTAIVSAGLYPVAASYALLARVGAPAAWQPLLLFGAAGFDLLLGVLSLWWPARLGARAKLWGCQIALIAFYTLVISWRLPEYWLHPYGPLSKNLPFVAVLICLLQLDTRGER